MGLLHADLTNLLGEQAFGKLLVHVCVGTVVDDAVVAVCEVGDFELVGADATADEDVDKDLCVLLWC